MKQIDLVAHGWAGSVVLAVNEDDPRIRRVIAFNTPLLAEVPSVLAENFLLDGGRFSTLASSPAGAQVFELLFSTPGRSSRRALIGGCSRRARAISRSRLPLSC